MSITIIIIIITGLVSFSAFKNSALMMKLMFTPYRIASQKEWYRFFSNGLIHADELHLFMNMFVLYSFGSAVEHFYKINYDGKWLANFLILYVGGLAASVLPTYQKQKNNSGYNALGASGAVSAVTFAYITFRPFDNLYIFGALPCPAVLFGILYIVFCYYMSKRGGDFINHDAHLWGGVFGFVLTIVLKPEIFLDFLNQFKEKFF